VLEENICVIFSAALAIKVFICDILRTILGKHFACLIYIGVYKLVRPMLVADQR
jgi:hypothetical protein